MKKTLKRLGALALALCLVLALSSVAFAADTTFTNGVAGAFNTTDKDGSVTVDTDKTITIQKELTAYNPDGSQIHAPEITYTYTITAGDGGKVIIDNPDVHNSGTSSKVLTKAGVIGGLSVTGALNKVANTAVVANATDTSVANTIQFTTDGTLTTAADGSANMSNLIISFAGVSFTGAGVYRYVITEKASAYESNGVVDGNGGEDTQVRYLDVYVKDGASAGTYDVYGYVCFKNNNNIEYPTSDSVAAAEKTNGFVDTDTSDPDASNADKYYTFDVQIKKDLVNDQAMNGHPFPFKVTFANTKVISNVLLNVEGTEGKTTKPTPVAGAISATVYDGKEGGAGSQIKIADDGEVKLIGIPAGTLVTIAEYNDVVGTTYKVNTVKGTTNIAPAVALEWNNWSADITALGGTANTNAKVGTNFTATGNNEILFTNTLEIISPTGVVFRVAPYILILCAGVVLLVLSRRRRMADDEA